MFYFLYHATNILQRLRKQQAIFEKMDWDKNGEISKIEFKSYLAKYVNNNYIAKSFHYEFKDIEQTLLCNIIDRLEKGENIDADAVYKAFEQMDLDRSKSLDWLEFLVRKISKEEICQNYIRYKCNIFFIIYEFITQMCFSN